METSILFMNEAAQSSDTVLIAFSEQGSWVFSFFYLKFKVLAL
jgi:hypothetical protein